MALLVRAAGAARGGKPWMIRGKSSLFHSVFVAREEYSQSQFPVSSSARQSYPRFTSAYRR